MTRIEENIHRTEENPDSLEIGTPAKGGAIKIYGNYDKPDEFRAKIDKAITLREYAKNKIEQTTRGY